MNKFLLMLAFTSALLSNGQNSNSTVAQNDSTQPGVEKFLFKIKAFPFGIEGEVGLGRTTTLVAEGAFLFGFSVNNEDEFNDEDETDFVWLPWVDLQFRQYYNFQKRLADGKDIRFNSGNFFALKYLTYFVVGDDDAEENYLSAFGPVWGLQRNYQEHWNIAFEAGLGAYWNSSGGAAPIPIISFNVGYNF
ncbi:hypothetical protein GCM10009117_16210 [Gangjinia marincola]|uniref:Secreted protein n=1 Tax=Gangjinia marincola TaxID=578463 RepID=A0ABP3XVR6_9FLAO